MKVSACTSVCVRACMFVPYGRPNHWTDGVEIWHGDVMGTGKRHRGAAIGIGGRLGR